MTSHKPTYDEWLTWDDKVWRSRLCVFTYPADYENDWEDPDPLLPPIEYVRVDEPPGPHWTEKVRNAHYKKLNRFLKDGANWILVEPFVVSDTAGRWVVFGNFLHKTSLYFGLLSLYVLLFSPQKTKIYWTTTSLSLLTAFGYWAFAMDPISNYQMVEDKQILSQFPMKSFYPMKPKVLKRASNIYRRLSHRLVAFGSLAYAVYYMKYPPPFCYCGWDVAGKFQTGTFSKELLDTGQQLLGVMRYT